MNPPKRPFISIWKVEDRHLINLIPNIVLMFLLVLSISVSAFAQDNTEEVENQEPYILDEIIVTESGYGVKQNLTATKTNTPLRDMPQSI